MGKEQIAMVGDRLYTDIAAGRNNGLKSILVLSLIFHAKTRHALSSIYIIAPARNTLNPGNSRQKTGDRIIGKPNGDIIDYLAERVGVGKEQKI